MRPEITGFHMVGEEELSSELLLFSSVVVTVELFMYSLQFLKRFQNAQGCR